MTRERRIESFRALRALWREDLATYHGQFSRPGFQALAVLPDPEAMHDDGLEPGP